MVPEEILLAEALLVEALLAEAPLEVKEEATGKVDAAVVLGPQVKVEETPTEHEVEAAEELQANAARGGAVPMLIEQRRSLSMNGASP